MKKLALLVMVFFLAFNGVALAAHATGHFDNTLSAYGPHGFAPNSGDGIPDGSGLESPFGPFGDD